MCKTGAKGQREKALSRTQKKKKGILSIQTPASGKTGKPYCQYCSVLQSPHVKEAAEVKTNESESHRILSKALEASCSFTSLQSREEADLIIYILPILGCDKSRIIFQGGNTDFHNIQFLKNLCSVEFGFFFLFLNQLQQYFSDNAAPNK